MTFNLPLHILGMSELKPPQSGSNGSPLPRAATVVQTHLARIRAAAAAGNMDLVMKLTYQVDGCFRKSSDRFSRCWIIMRNNRVRLSPAFLLH